MSRRRNKAAVMRHCQRVAALCSELPKGKRAQIENTLNKVILIVSKMERQAEGVIWK